tara:strand:- start:2534 stop:2887 length:354 start_codon:yes stop_codon:yes gene_type:complete
MHTKRQRGGYRPGAGRPKGSPNKATAARQREIEQSGVTPLDYMLSVMRDEDAPPARRDEMAKAAAPYVHPKLASTQISGPNGGPIVTEGSARERLYSLLSRQIPEVVENELETGDAK